MIIYLKNYLWEIIMSLETDILALLKYTLEKRASDLHISSGMPPMIRVDGALKIVPGTEILNSDTVRNMLHSIFTEAQSQALETKLDLDLAFSISANERFRINVFNQYRGLSAAFRALESHIPSFDELGFPETFQDLCKLPHGLILVTGPTGSGKTTTMASMIDYINQTKHGHILTIEDPIEYIFKSKSCLVQQREVKTHTESFANALRAALREDPDYILVGEMRDIETIRLALTAAETGHLVFATLHTNSAAESIYRIIDAFPPSEKEMVRSVIAGSLQAIISQILVKKVNGGRIAAQEILVCSPAIRNLIREDKIQQIYSVLQTGQEKGMRTLEQHLEELIGRNEISDIIYAKGKTET